MSNSASYQITGCIIKSTASERDLGLSVSSDLTWNNQVYEQAARANKLLGYIQRNAKFTINTWISVRRTLYVGVVRPILVMQKNAKLLLIKSPFSSELVGFGTS